MKPTARTRSEPANRRPAAIGRRAGSRPPAFTLIELVVAIAASAVVSGLAGLMLLDASRQRSQVAARCELVDIAARAVEQCVRYVREIPQDVGLAGKAQISAASATSLRFGNSGFQLNGGVFEMTIDNGASWRPMARDAGALAFKYFNAAGTELAVLPLSQADRESVRTIQVLLTLTRAGESSSIRTSLYLRAFMNEVLNAP